MPVSPAPAEGDLLLPTPLAGVRVGYGRVSTREQNLARQQAALSAAGCAKCFFDKATPQRHSRPARHKIAFDGSWPVPVPHARPITLTAAERRRLTVLAYSHTARRHRGRPCSRSR